jgi:hypothetical protein
MKTVFSRKKTIGSGWPTRGEWRTEVFIDGGWSPPTLFSGKRALRARFAMEEPGGDFALIAVDKPEKNAPSLPLRTLIRRPTRGPENEG